MTSNVETIYQNALLADAAYIDFKKGADLEIDGKIKDEETYPLFRDRGFTLEQFDKFQNKYKVYQAPNGELAHQQNTLDGFAATIFQDRATEKLTVAFRGTEPGGGIVPGSDLLQDVILALGLSSTLGQVMQDGKIDGFLESAGLVDSSGNPSVGFEHQVDFVGHSLGGHLTLMAAYAYPGLLDQAHTFNGAGTTGLDSLYLDHVKPLLAPLMNQVVLDPNRINNYFAKPGFEVTANEFPFLRSGQGDRDGLFIEKQGADLSMDNHSMRFLVDALSVQRILALLGGNLDPGVTDTMLWQAHNREIEIRADNGTPDASNPDKAAKSLDLVMAHLATVLGGAFAALNTLNDAEAFYSELTATGAPVFTLKTLSGIG
ncbi:MAG: hypothetical protein H7A00_00945 [Hahellaceae bacterium]|nr:hypothetical protein [Hahellaceae bacterium]